MTEAYVLLHRVDTLANVADHVGFLKIKGAAFIRRHVVLDSPGSNVGFLRARACANLFFFFFFVAFKPSMPWS